MSRHYKPTTKDRIIDAGTAAWGLLVLLAYGVDMKLTPMVTYFQTASYGTIITDFLAYVAVIGIILIPVVAVIVSILIYF